MGEICWHSNDCESDLDCDIKMWESSAGLCHGKSLLFSCKNRIFRTVSNLKNKQLGMVHVHKILIVCIIMLVALQKRVKVQL